MDGDIHPRTDPYRSFHHAVQKGSFLPRQRELRRSIHQWRQSHTCFCLIGSLLPSHIHLFLPVFPNADCDRRQMDLIAFHAFCFKSQTSQQQPDIHQFPLTFSYLYITAALLFNINTILVSYWSSKNIFTALWFTVTSIWEGITSFIQIIP